MPPNIKEHGLTEGQIKTDTEIKLRAAGIRVIPTIEELRKEAGKPWLYIAVNTSYKPTLRFFSFSIDIKLQQQVRLERNPTVIISATTWATGSTGAVGENDVQQIRGFVKDLVDKFINAYLTANPKK